MSSNWSLRSRNPAVAEFARLFATVSRFACCALMPLAAVYNARIISSSFRPAVFRRDRTASNARQVLRRNLVKTVIEDAERLLHHLRLPLHQDHLHGAVNRIFI